VIPKNQIITIVRAIVRKITALPLCSYPNFVAFVCQYLEVAIVWSMDFKPICVDTLYSISYIEFHAFILYVSSDKNCNSYIMYQYIF